MKLTTEERSRVKSFWHLFGASVSEIKIVCRIIEAERKAEVRS